MVITKRFKRLDTFYVHTANRRYVIEAYGLASALYKTGKTFNEIETVYRRDEEENKLLLIPKTEVYRVMTKLEMVEV